MTDSHKRENATTAQDTTNPLAQPTEISKPAIANDQPKTRETVAECDEWYASRKKQLEDLKQELSDRRVRLVEYRESAAVLSGRVVDFKADSERREQQRKREMEEHHRKT